MDYYGRKMLHRFEQVILYSEGEYRRRIDAIRKVMAQHGVQVTIFLECAEEAYDEWLTGRRLLEYVIVPEEGEILGVLWNEYNEEETNISSVDFTRYVMQKPQEAVFDGIRFLNRVTDERIADILAASKPERIGVVLPQQMNALLADAIDRKMPKAELVDLTIPVALARAPKSDEELYVVKQARDIQVAIYDALPQIIRVGRSVDEIGQECTYMLHQLGGSGVVHCGIMCFGPQDQPSSFGGMMNHKVEYGDRYFTLLESNGPGHHHVAFGRHIVVGEPLKEWKKCVDDAVAIHKYAVSLMKPDSLTLAQIAVKTRKYCNKLGYTLRESVGWNWMHSLGGYYYEQYSLEDYTEDIPLEDKVMLHCHPLIYRNFPNGAREDLFILNTYQVTADGAKDLVGVPLGLRVLD